MNKIAALAIVLAAGAAANAQVINYGSTGPLLGNQANVQVFPVVGSGNITGFRLTGDMLATSGSSWQSDMRLILTSPDNVVFDVGGFTNEQFAWNDPVLMGTGTFPASNANAGIVDVTYPANLGTATGNWTVELRNDWDSTFAMALQWDNVNITLIPAPGSLALLGLSGMVALRRRR